MFPIKRTIEAESYTVTADWLKDFANSIIAKASVPPSPFLTTSSTEKFATIEDKMADMKARVGFDNITKQNGATPATVVKSAKADRTKVVKKQKCDCGKGKDCTCQTKYKPSKERMDKLQSILKYITDMMAAEPHLLEPEIRSRCIDNHDLGFEGLRIRPDKLSKFIEKRKGPQTEAAVVYFAPDTKDQEGYQNDVADYYSHSSPAPR